MGMIRAMIQQQHQRRAMQPDERALPAATFAGQPEFTKQMALTGQLQQGMPMPGKPTSRMGRNRL